jgi:hypothetical protein
MMTLYRVICKPTKACHNNDITYNVVSENIYDAESLVKNHIKEKDERFLSVVPVYKDLLIDIGVRSDLKLRNCLHPPQILVYSK